MAEELFCSTCDLTVDSKGQASHQPTCVNEQLKKHRNALEKIGHILKEVGIGVAETAVDIALHGTGGEDE